jgi:hypothetical protein
VKRKQFQYLGRHLERWPLGTSYIAIVDHLAEMFGKAPLKATPLIVDGTGVGRAVVDMIRKAKVVPDRLLHPITITGGHTVSFTERSHHVPKKDLVGCLQVLLQKRLLRIARTIPEAETLTKELQNFKVRITPAANEVFDTWREGEHDDLVLALAIAVWWAERYSLIPEIPKVPGPLYPGRLNPPAWW